MKKSISLLLVLTVILGIFFYLGSGSGEETAEEENLAVTLVVSSAFGDKSLNDSAREGGELLKTNPGISVNYIECHRDGIKQKLMDAADESDMVIAVGWECYEISEVAVEYPDVKFIMVDDPAEGIESLPNMMSITFAQNEGAYLAGFIAAQMSETGILGTLAEEESENVNDYITGFSQGAKHANPDVVIKSLIAADPANPSMAREDGLKLADQGADVILNLVTGAPSGVFQAAREREMYAVGIDADQKINNPDYDNVILCSVKKDLGMSIYDAVMEYADEEIWRESEITVSDLKSGHVSLVYGSDTSIKLVSDEMQAAADEIAQLIEAGEIKVKTAR